MREPSRSTRRRETQAEREGTRGRGGKDGGSPPGPWRPAPAARTMMAAREQKGRSSPAAPGNPPGAATAHASE